MNTHETHQDPSLQPPTVFGESYAEWKGWNANNFGASDWRLRTYFNAELTRIKAKLPGSPRVLEIGFGSGSFMAYCRSRHWDVIGLEANPALVDYGLQAGFRCLKADALTELPAQSFDLVVAFDVLEHLAVDQIMDTFVQARRLLVDNGAFLVRFPNGDSMLSAPYQHGDSTHITAIGSLMAKDLAVRSNLSVHFIGAPAYPARWSSPASWALKIVRKIIGSAGNFFINRLYFPGEKFEFFSPNLTCIFRKTPPRADK
jgi:SAM-dependent methyltransferase